MYSVLGMRFCGLLVLGGSSEWCPRAQVAVVFPRSHQSVVSVWWSPSRLPKCHPGV